MSALYKIQSLHSIPFEIVEALQICLHSESSGSVLWPGTLASLQHRIRDLDRNIEVVIVRVT